MSTDTCGIKTEGKGAAGVWWGKANGAIQHPTVHRQCPTTEMPSLRLRNPGLNENSELKNAQMQS